MEKRTTIVDEFIRILREYSKGFTDIRTGKNTQYEVSDAVICAFSIFFMQSPSFLSGQRRLEEMQGISNEHTMFQSLSIPSDSQIRRLLDEIDPKEIAPFFEDGIRYLEKRKYLDLFRGYAGKLLIAVDGTSYQSSNTINCEKCSVRQRKNGTAAYLHFVVAPALVQSGSQKNQVIAIEPEYIEPQDGWKKQDCERAAFKRWLELHGEKYAQRGATILGDDLYSNEPICKLILEKKLNFILTCKESSHTCLFRDEVRFREWMTERIETVQERKWTGKKGEIHTYRFINQLPIRASSKDNPDPLKVNWCELNITDEETGKKIFYNSYITNFEITTKNVVDIVQDGRSRWSVENGSYNILKNHGFHGDHNFGHGDNHLAAFLFSLNLIAFLIHTIANLADPTCRELRSYFINSHEFFIDIKALTTYFVFDTWGMLFSAMLERKKNNKRFSLNFE